MLDELLKISNISKIEDIYVFGYSDNDNGILKFNSDLRLIYFVMDSFYIRFESIENYSRLEVSIQKKLAYPFEYELESELTMTISSLKDLLLLDSMSNSNKISKLTFFNPDDDNCLICDALEITLMNNQLIFFDPSYYFGISVGGLEQKKCWTKNIENIKKITKKEVVTNWTVNNIYQL